MLLILNSKLISILENRFTTTSAGDNQFNVPYLFRHKQQLSKLFSPRVPESYQVCPYHFIHSPLRLQHLELSNNEFTSIEVLLNIPSLFSIKASRNK